MKTHASLRILHVDMCEGTPAMRLAFLRFCAVRFARTFQTQAKPMFTHGKRFYPCMRIGRVLLRGFFGVVCVAEADGLIVMNRQRNTETRHNPAG